MIDVFFSIELLRHPSLMAVATHNQFQLLVDCDLPAFAIKPDVRYDVTKTSHRVSTTQYRNYIVLSKELAGMKHGERQGRISKMLASLADPAKVAKETHTRVLMYELRLQALVWAFFGGREHTKTATRDFASHPGYEEAHTEKESAILSGYYTAITNFRSGKLFAARGAFDVADKAFGELRHAEWLAEWRAKNGGSQL